MVCLVTSPSEVGNGSPSKGAATTPTLEVGKEVGDGWGIIPGMLFLVLRRCTWGWHRSILDASDSWILVGLGGEIHLVRGLPYFVTLWKVHQVPLYVGLDGLVSDFFIFLLPGLNQLLSYLLRT